MRLKTAAALLKNGRLFLLLLFKRLFTNFYRVGFLASINDSTILEQLARGPVSIDALFAHGAGAPSKRSAIEAWLNLGLQLRLVKKDKNGYRLRGFLAKRFAAPENNDIRALVREAAGLHHLYIMDTPEKLEEGALWDPNDQHKEYGDIIARSSQTLEPFLFEVIDRFFPKSDKMSLLEVGCGNAGYIIYALKKYSGMTAVGLELDPDVAETACLNIRAGNVHDRVTITVSDVRNYRTSDLFDIVTLYNNIYYFPVEHRIELFTYLYDLLKPGGRIVLTTGCMNGGIEFELVNLIHSTSKGWGGLPYKDEMMEQLSHAGFEQHISKNLIPGDKYYVFVGHKPE